MEFLRGHFKAQDFFSIYKNDFFFLIVAYKAKHTFMRMIQQLSGLEIAPMRL